MDIDPYYRSQILKCIRQDRHNFWFGLYFKTKAKKTSDISEQGILYAEAKKYFRLSYDESTKTDNIDYCSLFFWIELVWYCCDDIDVTIPLKQLFLDIPDDHVLLKQSVHDLLEEVYLYT